jgi:hypothetical protein
MNTDRARTRVQAFITAILLVSALGLTACEEDKAALEIVQMDASNSALRTQSGLASTAATVLTTRANALDKGDTLIATAFASKPGSQTACSPLQLQIPQDANSEEVADLKAAYVSALNDGAVATYLECVRSDQYGAGDRGGSAIFSSITETITTHPDLTQFTLISDGCQVGEKELPQTCSPDALTDPKATAEAIGDDMVPDLADVPVTFYDLGQGTNLTGTNLVGLRTIWKDFFTRAGSNHITFN